MRRAVPLTLGALLLGGAQATDFTDLLVALRRARMLEVRGTATATVLFPPRAVPTRAGRALPLVVFRPALLQKNFNVTRAGEDTLAGRPVTRFDLIPKVGQAARWSLWIDQAWNLPLAYEERSADGTLARRAELTAVKAAPVKVMTTVPGVPDGLRAAVLAALPGLRFPAGFTPVTVFARPGGLEIPLTDGVNSLALVVSSRNVQGAPGVASQKTGGVFVWLVGNLPAAELSAALSGVRGADQAALGTFVNPAASKE